MNLVEPLEARIAPAAVFSFTDVDGDVVKITTSKGNNADLANVVHVVGGQLQLLDLSAATFGGEFVNANLTITATHAATGDGHVNVGFINASGVDLGNISIPGDLGRINCGDMNVTTPALKALSVASLGALGTTTQALGGNLNTFAKGPVGKVRILGDVVGASYYSTGKTGSIVIGGSVLDSNLVTIDGSDAIRIGGDLRGTGIPGTGSIVATGAIKSVTIGGSVIGEITDSGVISSVGGLGRVKIGGSLIGAIGTGSGKIASGAGIGSISIGGDVRGAQTDSGHIVASGNIGSVKVGGSLVGGGGDESGTIESLKTLGGLSIGGNVVGGAGNTSGYISSLGKSGAFTVGGSFLGGSGANSGALGADECLTLKIGGDLVGGNGSDSGSVNFNRLGTAFIGGSLHGGGANGSGTGELSVIAAKSVTIRGSIIGGLGLESGIVEASSIGSLKIGGSVVGGSTTNAGQYAKATGGVFVAKIDHLQIGGSILAGSRAANSTLESSGTIQAAFSLGDVKIGGSIVGNSTNAASIEVGSFLLTAGATVLKSLTVGGAVDHAEILAGFNGNKMAVASDVKVGTINFGSWTASNLSVGVEAGADNMFGTADDVLHAGGDPAIHSRIASIVIRGNALGSTAAGDNFGIVAEQIGTVKIGGYQVPLTAAKTDVFRLGSTGGATGDFFVREDV